MTVDELRDVLSDRRGDEIVVMSKDAEGNSYSPLAYVDFGHYEPDSTWSGEFTPGPESSETVCLVPVN